jgi:hypothetical protein
MVSEKSNVEPEDLFRWIGEATANIDSALIQVGGTVELAREALAPNAERRTASGRSASTLNGEGAKYALTVIGVTKVAFAIGLVMTS